MCSKGFSADDEVLKVGCSLCYKALLSCSDVNMKSWKSPSNCSFWRKHTDGVFSSGLDWMRSFMEMSFQAGNWKLECSKQKQKQKFSLHSCHNSFSKSFPRTPATKRPHFGSLSLKLSREPFFSVSLIEKKLLTIRLLWQNCSQGSHEPVKPPYDLSQERMPSQLMSVSQKRKSLNKKSHRHRGYSTNRSKHLCRRWRFQRHQAHA